MQEFLKIAVVFLMAIPFVYMFYDVLKDILQTTYKLLTEKAKPALVQVITYIFN